MFTTPPSFMRPAGSPAELEQMAVLLVGLADIFEPFGDSAERLHVAGSDLYWADRPGDGFWDGATQQTWTRDAVRRFELAAHAATTFRSAANTLMATASLLVQAQAGVEEAQSVANQRATADAASPLPTAFEQEQQIASTSAALARASAGEAAAQLRALTAAIPGYVAPAIDGTRTGAASLAARSAGSAGAATGAPNEGGAAAGSPGAAGAGSGSVSDSSSGGGDAGGDARSDASTDEPQLAGAGTGGGGGGAGAAGSGGGRADDDEDATVPQVEES